ncbi:MAG: glycosyltransferase family 4 protein [Verrucomicrobia bacterium]|nr:glycosyltransferase family 4 protein [Verrucomicrobiota bacterium]
MKPLAIVIPWFGRDLKGGAETHAWQIASRLAARGHAVEVITTCCRSHQDDWAGNHLPAGVTQEPEGFSVRRFAVRRRKRKQFDRVCGHLLGLPKTALKPGVSPVSAVDAAIFRDELIRSPALLCHLEQNANDYHAFIFIPYLYGPILNGLPLVASKAWLLPCLHDESYAYLLPVADIFRKARGILFISEGELELALRLFGPGIIPKSVVVGGGVEVPDVAEAAAPVGTLFPFGNAPYVLCLGRKDSGKNSLLLLSAFRAFKAASPNSRLKLVYAGIGSIALDGLEGQVFDLGTVSEQDKVALLDGCRALFQPSENESFSRVIMEAWRRGRPVAVHRQCLATATAVRHGGGWLAADEREWSALLAMLERASDDELAAKGAAGREYVREVADWRNVMDRYERVLFSTDAVVSVSSIRVTSEKNRAVHQVLPNLAYGDAISNFVRWIRRTLRFEGIVSEIFVRHIDPKVAGECRPFAPGCVAPEDVLLYHHSVGSNLTPHVVGHPGPKCLIYHNITPAKYFEPFCPDVVRLLRQGREELRLLARAFPISVGGSEYNACELRDVGFADPGVLPYVIDPAQWNAQPDARLMEQLQDGHTNLLFVGRLAPNKKQDDLIRLFRHYLRFDPDAVLHLVGGAAFDDPYQAHLKIQVEMLNLGQHVKFVAGITNQQLAAYYRTAHLFWSMSEHEGFCVPLIEAMWFDVPVLAFKSSAIPGTLADAGLMFTTKQHEDELAALAWLMVHDDDLRRKVTAAQRRRRTRFLPSAVAPQLLSLVDNLVNPTN